MSLAKRHHAWAVAPGYGFLSESAEFAQAVEESGMVWIGPTSATLATFSNKVTAKRLASQCSVPVLPGTPGDCATFEQVLAFARQLPAQTKLIIKAVAGGGGRGMRVVAGMAAGERALREAFDSCVREAELSFGDSRVYAERFLDGARHIEVQVVGDGTGDVAHLWERECSIQRRHQKLIEIAPSPSLPGGATNPTRRRILDAALQMAARGRYKSLGTFEFLYLASTDEFFFMEANPRIQVEHTV